jgi:hypothetical protein
MARARFVHIGFGFTGQPPVDELKKVFDKALDWMRYSDSNWILYTTTDINVWRDRIRQLNGISTSDSVFLCEFELGSKTGYMHDWVWTWLSKPR